jgi:hypothetical protein
MQELGKSCKKSLMISKNKPIESHWDQPWCRDLLELNNSTHAIVFVHYEPAKTQAKALINQLLPKQEGAKIQSL